MSKATFKVPGDLSLEVDADYSTTGQFRCFKLSGGQATIATAQGESAPLVLQNKPTAAGDHGHFTYAGVSSVELGGTVAALGPLTTGTGGALEAAITGDQVVGIALEAGVTGDVISAILGIGGAPLA